MDKPVDGQVLRRNVDPHARSAVTEANPAGG